MPDVHKFSGVLQMDPSPLDKQTSSYDSPYDWLMTLAMDLLLCVICRGGNGTNGCHLAVFSLDVAFSCHFVTLVATHLPPHSHPIGIGYTLSKMVHNSASYPRNSWLIDRL